MRQLIELGELVQKAGLVTITDDNRATLYGAFLDLAARMQGDDGTQMKLLFQRRGIRTFAMETEAKMQSTSVQEAPVESSK